jgi:hypothetical protein
VSSAREASSANYFWSQKKARHKGGLSVLGVGLDADRRYQERANERDCQRREYVNHGVTQRPIGKWSTMTT